MASSLSDNLADVAEKRASLDNLEVEIKQAEEARDAKANEIQTLEGQLKNSRANVTACQTQLSQANANLQHKRGVRRRNPWKGVIGNAVNLQPFINAVNRWQGSLESSTSISESFSNIYTLSKGNVNNAHNQVASQEKKLADAKEEHHAKAAFVEEAKEQKSRLEEELDKTRNNKLKEAAAAGVAVREALENIEQLCSRTQESTVSMACDICA